MTERSVIVTGGFGTLGRAVAAAFVTHGDRVARVDFARTAPDPLGTLDLGGVDLADPASSAAAVAQITAALGAPAVLVNIAGGFVWETVETGEPATWERMFRMNLLSTLTITRAALPGLRQAPAGRIVNIGAGAALKAAAGMGAYTTSKSGVHRFTESLAEELKDTAITVNAVLPSTIDTPANRADMPTADFSTWVTPQAIADVILFLASPASRAITGALIPVSRGG